MPTIAKRTSLTPEDLLRIPEDKNFELIDGQLVERNGSALSSWVGGEVLRHLRNFSEPEQIGWVFGSDLCFHCFPDRPNTIRRSNVSFVRAGRFDWDRLSDDWLRLAPDLVVDVVSPKDLAYELDQKIETFFEVGVPILWIVNPDVRTIKVIRADGSTTTLREGGTLSGEDVIPGFACPVASIFPPKPASPPTQEKARPKRKA